MCRAKQKIVEKLSCQAWRPTVIVISLGLLFIPAAPSFAGTLDRVRQTGTLVLGYRSDTRPFSFANEAGQPEGYSVTLCEQVAAEVRSELNLSQLSIEWVPVDAQQDLTIVAQAKVDLLCGAETVTLRDREKVSFSIPVYLGGISGMLRTDSTVLKQVLSGNPPTRPFWRASPARILQDKTFSVVSGSRTQTWLSGRLDQFQLSATIVPVESYKAGTAALLQGKADVFFGDRAVLQEAAAESASPSNLIILGRLFTFEPTALALARNDDDFRLSVDRALSQYFRSGTFWDTYTKWFGVPDDAAATFFAEIAVQQ